MNSLSSDATGAPGTVMWSRLFVKHKQWYTKLEERLMIHIAADQGMHVRGGGEPRERTASPLSVP